MITLKEAYIKDYILHMEFNNGLIIEKSTNELPKKVEYKNCYDEKFWASLCKKCGDCCYYRWISPDGTLNILDLHCRFFDPETKLCKEFANRENIKGGCVRLSPTNMLEGLPEHCGYREFLEG